MAIKIKGGLDDGNGLHTLQVLSNGTLTTAPDPDSDELVDAPPVVTSDEQVAAASGETPGYLEDVLTTTGTDIEKATVGGAVNLSLPDVVTGGTIGGGGNIVESLTYDDKGRITDATSVPLPTSGGALDTVAPIGVATNAIGFTGLDGDTDVGYKFRFRIRNDNVGTSTYELNINGATTGITWQRLYGTSGTTVQADGTDSIMISANATMDIYGEIHALTTANHRRNCYLRIALDDGAGAAVLVLQAAIVWNNTVDNITAISFTSDTIDGVGIGSDGSISVQP